jgi:hypothetical protein
MDLQAAPQEAHRLRMLRDHWGPYLPVFMLCDISARLLNVTGTLPLVQAVRSLWV